MIADGLSDEHMGHVFRFLGLGKFDRAEWERQRAYAQHRARHWQMMRDRDEREASGNATTVAPVR